MTTPTAVPEAVKNPVQFVKQNTNTQMVVSTVVASLITAGVFVLAANYGGKYGKQLAKAG